MSEKKNDSAALAAGQPLASPPQSDAAPHVAHTPGPWSAGDTHDAFCGNPYCSVNGCPENHPSGRYAIDGPAWNTDYLQAGIPAVDNKFDAHLIAAAPELYELALKVAEHFADTDAPLGAAAVAAIAKAEGRS